MADDAGIVPSVAGVDFFVSHAGHDQAWAEWVAWHLLDAGYTVELDSWDWAAGDNFVVRMHRAVNSAKRVVALFSPAYFEASRYTNDEWSAAIVKDERGEHRLVPVQVAPCTVPPLFRPLVRVELFDVDEAEAARRLLAAARGPARPNGKPSYPGSGVAGILSTRGEPEPRLPGVLPAVWNLGPRNPGFVGRDTTLVYVRERLRSGATTVVQALHGMGGVGKTQVAIEYAYRYAGAYDVVWWVAAEETGLVGEQYAELAAELALAPRHADTATAVGALRAYLRGHNRWLLVLDNAESPGDLRNWIPAGPGHVLITSRNPGWGELAVRVEVSVLSRPESVELIRTYRPGEDTAEANCLAEALGDLPLALAQAAGFLSETGMPIVRYLDLLSTRADELLDQSPPQAHPRSLAAAVRMTTDQLAALDPAALALVRIASFLAPEPVPAELLIREVPTAVADAAWPPELVSLTAVAASPVAAHRSVGRIGSFGLARVGRGLDLHRITQAVLRDQLTPTESTSYRGYAQALLVAADPGDELDPATWPGWSRMVPHILAVGTADGASRELRELACRAIWYLWIRGENRLARDFSIHLHGEWHQHFGPDDQYTLRIGSQLVRILIDVGPYEQAQRLGEDTFARCRRVLGDDHPDTLRAAHFLAACLHKMGEFERARHVNEDALARRRRVLGADHLESHRTAHNLARDLRALGELAAARRLQEETLAYRRGRFGDDHPHSINTANELGGTMRAMGEFDAARRLHDDTVTRARRVLGENHLWTVDGMKELAADLRALGDRESARILAEDVVSRARRVVGDDSHFTVEATNHLVADLLALGEVEQARRLAAEADARARRVLGEQHPHSRTAAANLSAVQRSGSSPQTTTAPQTTATQTEA